MKKREGNRKKGSLSQKFSLSGMFTFLVAIVVLFTSMMILITFIRVYRDAMEENAITSCEQSVVQVKNTVSNYTEDMGDVMNMLCSNIDKEKKITGEFFQQMVKVRTDVVAIMEYDMNGNLLNCWSDGYKLKDRFLENPSYIKELPEYEDGASKGGMLNISKPHVSSLFVNYYPWVVTISQKIRDSKGKIAQISMDIRFDNIADYIDDVGIGQHGYSYIADGNGNIIYHPQQQLIYSGLKEEKQDVKKDGTYMKPNVIYTVNSLDNCDWNVIGVCYVDEMITNRVEKIVNNLIVILSLVMLATLLLGGIFSGLFSKPVKQLVNAMGKFEGNKGEVNFQPVGGTREIAALSDSFEHMVYRIQNLMEQVRLEEVSLRKTELKALQAQINPHFLYNTLDAIAWLCEEERNEDAVEMVNALARLFRISISKGHELIPIEKELQHAKSYLQIQNFRYKNQFTYSFDVDPECLSYLCNKITLQPIIENAIYHGMDRMVDEGEIRIGIHQADDNIILTVEDNGVGMTEQQCREVLHKEPGDRVGIGIKNVNDRIKIYFGNEYGLTITSELDEGTCVTICMPKITENSYEEK